jgi:microcystin-dependent protein
MFWASNAQIPVGWFVCSGGSFDRNRYPMLNAIIVGMYGGTSGSLPDWRGRFLHHTNSKNPSTNNGGQMGQKLDAGTANPTSGLSIDPTTPGEHKHEWVRQSGSGAGTSTGSNVIRDKDSGAGNNKVTYRTAINVTDDGRHEHNFTGWDNVTRPDTVAGVWIIKAD